MSDFNCPTFQKNDIQLLKTGNLADGTIKCNGRTWKVHRILLASRLQFFKAAFYGDFSEGTSGEVNFPEADPDAVDIMLRHLYREDLGVKALNTPTVCIRCWKLADYLQLYSLTSLAAFTLRQHLDATALLVSSNQPVKVVEHKPLRDFFHAFGDVCGDVATKPLQTAFVTFLWVTRYDTLVLPETLDILDKWPEVNKKLLELVLWDDSNEDPRWIPDIYGIESIIRQRTDVIFPNEVTCSRCHKKIKTCEETVSYNPFPVVNWGIGQLMWCKKCVLLYNEECCWPWRRDYWMKMEEGTV